MTKDPIAKGAGAMSDEPSAALTMKAAKERCKAATFSVRRHGGIFQVKSFGSLTCWDRPMQFSTLLAAVEWAEAAKVKWDEAIIERRRARWARFEGTING